MKLQRLYLYTLSAVGAIALAACSSTPRAPMSADADAQSELNMASAMIEEGSAKQYDRISPKNFETAVSYRNSAAEKLSKGKDREKVLSDIAASKEASMKMKMVGDANQANMRGVLESRRLAVEAQGQKFAEKEFTSADKDLRSIGRELESGSYDLDAKELAKIQKKFGESEIVGRQHEELGNVKTQIAQAKSNGAKSKVPTVYEMAISRYDSAIQAIALSPHTSSGYAPAVTEAKAMGKKLEEVLAIARKNDANEKVALTIWNQNQQLEASRNALNQTKTDAEKKLEQTKAEADAELAKTQSQAIAEQERLSADIDSKNSQISSQGGAIAALKSQNNEYASTEELKQKIEELKSKFSAEEAEVMKDGTKLVVRLKKMNFATNRADLNPDSFSTLRKVDDLILAVPAKTVTVEGHTDAVGSNKINQPLSEKRAESVKKYLVSQGLSEELRIDAQGFGSNRPLTTNKTKEGRATNRRVDIVIDTPVVL